MKMIRTSSFDGINNDKDKHDTNDKKNNRSDSSTDHGSELETDLVLVGGRFKSEKKEISSSQSSPFACDPFNPLAASVLRAQSMKEHFESRVNAKRASAVQLLHGSFADAQRTSWYSLTSPSGPII
eukprot:1796992-Amphidinium_carterae.1